MRKTIEYYIDQYRKMLQMFADEYDRCDDESDETYKLLLMTRSSVYNRSLADMELLLKLCDVYDL